MNQRYTRAMNYWLLKSDPDTYAWPDLVREGKTRWDGIRNAQARNFLREMKVGDLALFYHSQTERAVVGVVEIVRAAYADPTAKEGDWSCVDIRPVEAWNVPVPLAEIRAKDGLKDLLLLKQGRLSVTPIPATAWKAIKALRP